MREKIASVQFLRFVAAALVVVFHTFQALNNYFPGNVGGRTQYLTGIGEAGVHIFFVISGFVMVYTSFGNTSRPFSTLDFLSRRFIRIYPIYFVYAALYLAAYELIANGKSLTIFETIGSLMLLPGYSSLIIGPGWTLSYEVYFYLWFGVVMIMGLSRGLVILTLIFISSIALRFALLDSGDVLHLVTSPLLIEFLLGAWIGYAVVTGATIGARTAAALVLASLGGFAVAGLYGYHRASAVATWAIPSALLVAGCVFAEINGKIPSVMIRLSFLGDSSYSLYLLHILLIDLALFTLTHSMSVILPMNYFVAVALGLAITGYCIVVSAVSYNKVERHLVSTLQKLYRKRATIAVRLP